MENKGLRRFMLIAGIYIFAVASAGQLFYYHISPINFLIYFVLQHILFVFPLYSLMFAYIVTPLSGKWDQKRGFWQMRGVLLWAFLYIAIGILFFVSELAKVYFWFILLLALLTAAVIITVFTKKQKNAKGIGTLALCTIALILSTTDIPAQWIEAQRFRASLDSYMQVVDAVKSGEISIKTSYGETYFELPKEYRFLLTKADAGVAADGEKAVILFYNYWDAGEYTAYAYVCSKDEIPYGELTQLDTKVEKGEQVADGWYWYFSP